MSERNKVKGYNIKMIRRNAQRKLRENPASVSLREPRISHETQRCEARIATPVLM
jgi:hypothetical protein